MIDDLGADSANLMMLVMDLEAEYNTTVDDDMPSAPIQHRGRCGRTPSMKKVWISGGKAVQETHRLPLSAIPALLETALTHPSYGGDHHVPHYQRLEFLGDAVLELAGEPVSLR